MYVTQQDYIDAYGEIELIQLTDRDENGQVDDAAFDWHLNGAESFVNSRLASVYVIPLTAINASLKDIVLTITRANLFVNNETEEVTKNYDRALERLDDYINGVASIGDSEKTDISIHATSQEGPAAIFTDELFSHQNII